MEENQIPPIQEPTLENLTQQLAIANQLKDEYLAGWQRAKADFANYQKNEKDRIKDLLDFSQAAWTIKLLKIYDNFERAQQHFPPEIAHSEWAKGLRQIDSQFSAFFKEHGIEEVRALNQKFDPAIHEAIATEEFPGQESGIVMEVFEKGYQFHEQLLRPAKVKVSK